MNSRAESIRKISEAELIEKLKALPLSYNGEEPTVIHLKFGPSTVWIVEDNLATK